MSQCAGVQPDFSAWRFSPEDELVNTVTHGFGLVVSLVAALVMTFGVLAIGDAWFAVGCGAYLASLVGVYAMSTLSHAVSSERWKPFFRKLDQAFIYLLIVASYTPFSVAYLHGGFWWFLLAVMWTIALTGFGAKALFAHRVECTSIMSYVMLGWMPIIALPVLYSLLPAGAFALIVGGGLCYMLGTVFLSYDERVKYFHAAWHVLVIAGSACHYLALLAVVQVGR